MIKRRNSILQSMVYMFIILHDVIVDVENKVSP